MNCSQDSDLRPAEDPGLDGGPRLHPAGPRQGQPLPQLHGLVLIRGICQIWKMDSFPSKRQCGKSSCCPEQVIT